MKLFVYFFRKKKSRADSPKPVETHVEQPAPEPAEVNCDKEADCGVGAEPLIDRNGQWERIKTELERTFAIREAVLPMGEWVTDKLTEIERGVSHIRGVLLGGCYSETGVDKYVFEFGYKMLRSDNESGKFKIHCYFSCKNNGMCLEQMLVGYSTPDALLKLFGHEDSDVFDESKTAWMDLAQSWWEKYDE